MLSVGLKRWLVVATLATMTTGYGLYRYREQQMDKLYAAAAGLPPAFHGTVEAEAAVKKLGTYRGDRSTVMLLNIALGRTSFPWPDIQRAAMNALAARRDPKISVSLASLLQPHLTATTRLAVADALQTLPCSGECIASILHYLERVWRGEPNYEERTTFPPGLNEGVKADLAKDQEALCQKLYVVLRREARSTIEALCLVYGLGTSTPSRFSLTLLSRVKLREACAAVLESERLLKQSTAELFQAPREEVIATLQTLKCQ
jgi:hypothetical protein